MEKDNEKILSWRLLAVAVIALALRTYDIGRPFYASDPADVALYASRYYPYSLDNLYVALSYYHAPGTLLSGYAVLSLYRLLGVHATEFMWNLPYALLGSLNILILYALILRLAKSVNAAFTATLLLALYPLHAGFSRGSGYGHGTLALLFQTTTVLLFYLYYLKPSRLRALAASTSLSLTMLSDMLFPAIIPVALYAGAIASEKKDPSKLMRKIYTAEFILPAAVLLVELSVLLSQTGSIRYSLEKPDVSLGLHIKPFFINLLYFLGPFMLAACVLSLLHNARFAAGFGVRGLLASWSAAYSLPFLFVFKRCVTGYMLFPTAPMVLLAGVQLGFLMDSKGFRRMASILVAVILSALLFTQALESLRLVAEPPVKVLPTGFYCGSFFSHCDFSPCEYQYPGWVYGDEGYKAASYWIRKNTPESALVFSDHYGLLFAKRKSLAYYLHRQQAGLNIGARESMLKVFNSNKSSLDVLLVKPENLKLFGDLRPFRQTLVVESGGKPLLFVYTRGKYYDKPAHVEAAEYDRLFDAEYTTVDEITGGYPEWLWE